MPLSLWRLSWREWAHHPWRHGMALMAVALGVALAWSVHLINTSALAEFSSAVRAANGDPDLSLRSPRLDTSFEVPWKAATPSCISRTLRTRTRARRSSTV